MNLKRIETIVVPVIASVLISLFSYSAGVSQQQKHDKPLYLRYCVGPIINPSPDVATPVQRMQEVCENEWEGSK